MQNLTKSGLVGVAQKLGQRLTAEQLVSELDAKYTQFDYVVESLQLDGVLAGLVTHLVRFEVVAIQFKHLLR